MIAVDSRPGSTIGTAPGDEQYDNSGEPASLHEDLSAKLLTR